jgi:two-component system, NtrC family, nitrogen regulation sensor histidine kinase NtrY
MSPLERKQRWSLGIGGALLTFLLAAVFTFGSLDVPFEPGNWRVKMALFAVSSFVTALLLVFLLILVRTTLRLWAERSKEQLGARFKTKMVVGAMALSLLPVLFMFFVSYSLLNRTLGRWFPRPLEIASEQTQNLLNDFGRTSTLPRLRALALPLRAAFLEPREEFLRRAFESGLDAVWVLNKDGNPISGGVICENQAEDRRGQICQRAGVFGRPLRTLPSGLELWQADGADYLVARVPIEPQKGGEYIAAGYRTSPDFLPRFNIIQAQMQEYEKEKQNLRALKQQMLLILSFFTILLFFSVMWLALFLAKQVTVPIQALAEGTREVSAGNFDYQVPEQAQDELGVLVRSFNAMTTQLRDNRSQIDQFTKNLQLAVQELERRRQLMETVLENVPTGVISLDAKGAILRQNAAAARMFRATGDVNSLEGLVGAEASKTVQHLMRRALRMGVVSREVEMVVAGRMLHAAVTVSSLGPRRANTGFVVVLDDLTELLRAQKSAAWQEVARRIAHEIKNPLTPIQLSSQRLARFLERRDNSGAPRDPELTRLVQECSRLIEREVSTLAALVNEFSQFVRFPSAKLVPTNVNAIVHEAMEIFAGRLDGIAIKSSLAHNLPSVRADGGLLRSVIVNLIDNAAEALESSPLREISIATRVRDDADMIAICVEDTGHGISPQDKDKLFLPHFSTKDRGTGLGLAIAARIISEHGGTIHVEDNFPVGSRFLVELPIADLAPANVSERSGVEAS